jgi:hypothetical protein
MNIAGAGAFRPLNKLRKNPGRVLGPTVAGLRVQLNFIRHLRFNNHFCLQ